MQEWQVNGLKIKQNIYNNKTEILWVVYMTKKREIVGTDSYLLIETHEGVKKDPP